MGGYNPRFPRGTRQSPGIRGRDLYPGYGQVPVPTIFTPPINPNAPSGVPGGPGPNGEYPALSAAEQARYAPDLAPPGAQPNGTVVPPQAPQSGIRAFFDKLTSQPNANALLAAGSILSSAPMVGESPLAQAVRAIGGAVSTRGLYAQAQAAQIEAQRKAALEAREQSRKEQATASDVLRQGEQTRIDDRKVDADETKNKNDAANNAAKIAQDKAEMEANTAYRNQRLMQWQTEIGQKQQEIALAKKEMDRKRQAGEDERAFQQRQQEWKQKHEKALEDIQIARNGIAQANAANTKEALRDLRYWDQAKDIVQTAQSQDITGMTNRPAQTTLDRITTVYKGLKEGKGATLPAAPGASPATPAASAPKEGDTGREQGTNKPTVFKGGRWVYQSGQ